MKIPFGIAQVGKSFRNEITTKNFIFRSCEFEQMEMQYFCAPGEDEEMVRLLERGEDEVLFQDGNSGKRISGGIATVRMSSLSMQRDAYDIEFNFPMGWQELEGVHNRTDYDLTQHQNHSKKDLTYLDQETKERVCAIRSGDLSGSDPKCVDGAL